MWGAPLMRRVAVAVGVLILLLGAAAGVLIATFDAERQKALAVDWMRAQHQRTLVIDGPISLSLFPRLALKVSRLRLSERDRADEFIAADDAALAMQWLPLLRRQVVIDRVSARGVRLSYLRDASGRRNVEDFLPRPGTGTRPATVPAAETEPLRFDVSAVELGDLRLRLRDDKLGVAGEVVVSSLLTGRIAGRGAGAGSPLSLRASLQLTQPRAVSLAIDGRTTLALDVGAGRVTMGGLQLKVEGNLAGLTNLSLSLDGALAWDGESLLAGPLHIALQRATFGDLSLAPSTVDLQRARSDPGRQRLELDTLRVALAGRKGTQPFELSVDWPQGSVEPASIGGSPLSGRLRLAGDTPLAGSFRSAAPSGDFDALRLPGLAVTLAGGKAPRKIEAGAQADLMWAPRRGSAAVERLEFRATVADPGRPPLQLKLGGQVGADARDVSWALTGAIDADALQSTGRVSLAGAVPHVQADARFDRLDLNRLLAPGAATGAVPAAPAAEAKWPLQALLAFDGEFKVAAGAIAFRNYRASDVKLDATLADGTLRVARLTGRAWGGDIDASGSAEARRHRVGVKFEAGGVNVNALLKDVAGNDLVEGTGRVVADLQSEGSSLVALRSHLAGTAALQLRDGAIKGIDLGRVMRQARSALSLAQDTASPARAAEKTVFSRLSASARIAEGVATSNDLDVTTTLLRIGGAGRFDIGRGRVDYTARASIAPAADSRDAADLPKALRGVTVPVRLSGPFDAIDWKIEWSAVAATAAGHNLRALIEERLDARQGAAPAGAASAPAPPQDKLRERLQKLFR
jgi:AsmA protein